MTAFTSSSVYSVEWPTELCHSTLMRHWKQTNFSQQWKASVFLLSSLYTSNSICNASWSDVTENFSTARKIILSNGHHLKTCLWWRQVNMNGCLVSGCFHSWLNPKWISELSIPDVVINRFKLHSGTTTFCKFSSLGWFLQFSMTQSLEFITSYIKCKFCIPHDFVGPSLCELIVSKTYMFMLMFLMFDIQMITFYMFSLLRH